MAGINAVEDDKLRIYPKLQVKFRANDFIRLFAGFEGDTQFNSYHSNLLTNPWLAQSITLQNTEQKWMVSGGLTGSNERNVHYELKAAYAGLQSKLSLETRRTEISFVALSAMLILALVAILISRPRIILTGRGTGANQIS